LRKWRSAVGHGHGHGQSPELTIFSVTEPDLRVRGGFFCHPHVALGVPCEVRDLALADRHLSTLESRPLWKIVSGIEKTVG